MISIPNSFYRGLTIATFQRRLHRFAAEVEIAGNIETVHIPNSGRLQELLFGGNPVGLHFEGHPKRKTKYTLVKAWTAAGWSYIDSRLPNRVLAKHWRELPPLAEYTDARPESTYGASRFDLALRREDCARPAFLEAKCVTLVKENTGLFPDAPTERGRKHLQELAQIASAGNQAYVFFFLQHPGGQEIMANAETDPQFAALMAEASNCGVEFRAYRVTPGEQKVDLVEVPVIITI